MPKTCSNCQRLCFPLFPLLTQREIKTTISLEHKHQKPTCKQHTLCSPMSEKQHQYSYQLDSLSGTIPTGKCHTAHSLFESLVSCMEKDKTASISHSRIKMSRKKNSHDKINYKTYLYYRVIEQFLFVSCQNWFAINVDGSFALICNKEIPIVTQLDNTLTT